MATAAQGGQSLASRQENSDLFAKASPQGSPTDSTPSAESRSPQTQRGAGLSQHQNRLWVGGWSTLGLTSLVREHDTECWKYWTQVRTVHLHQAPTLPLGSQMPETLCSHRTTVPLFHGLPTIC